MKRSPHVCAAAAALSLSMAIAQAPIVPPLLLDQIERPWPPAMTGVDTSLACGRFVADHPGRSVVVTRDGRLHLWFAPAHLDLCIASDFVGAGALGTMPSLDASPDLLAVATAAGLRMLRWNGDTFVDAVVGQGAIATWIDVRDFATYVVPTPSVRCLLGRAPSWVRCTIVDPAGFVQPGVVFPAPVGQVVLDAEFLDWVPGGWPEIAVLTTGGTYVLDAGGTVLAAHAQPAIRGVLKALNRDNPPTLAQLREHDGVWRVESFSPATSFTPVDGGVLPVLRPVLGVGACDINGDAFTDLVVSTGESLRRIVLGRSGGFSAATAYRIDFFDVADLPPSPQENLAPLAVDDIDRDGIPDFVVAHRDSNQLVVSCRVRRQIQMAVYGILDEGGTVPSLQFTKGFGGVAGAPLPNIPNWQEQYVHFVRIQLPQQLPANAAVDAIVYPRPRPSNQPSLSATDPANLDGIAHFRYPVPSTAGGRQFDLMIPFHQSDVFAAKMVPAGRFVVELCVIEDVTNKAPSSTAPLFVECTVSNGSLFGVEHAALLDTSLLPPPWWAQDFLFVLQQWTEGSLEGNASTTVPVDARYFGAVVALKQPKVSGKPSAPPPSSGNGVVHN